MMLVKTVGQWRIEIVPLFSSHRIVERHVDSPFHYERFWCYRQVAAAVLAANAWDGAADTEPVGWFNKGGRAVRPTI